MPIMTSDDIAQACHKNLEGLSVKMPADQSLRVFVDRLRFVRTFTYPPAPAYTILHPRLLQRWMTKALRKAMKEAGL